MGTKVGCGGVFLFCLGWVFFWVFFVGGEGNCLKKTLTSASVAYSPSGLPVKGFFPKIKDSHQRKTF